MAKNIQHILHKKSNDANANGSPKLPTADVLSNGEIAINYKKGIETISIKNDNNEIVTFSSDNQINDLINSQLIHSYDSASTATNATYDAKTITDTINENERIVAAAYNSISDSVSSHASNSDIHITASERTAWNAKLDTTDLGTDKLFVRGFTKPTNMTGDAPFANGDSLSTVLTKIFEQLTDLSDRITALERNSNNE
jgi:hypothetical protein